MKIELIINDKIWKQKNNIKIIKKKNQKKIKQKMVAQRQKYRKR